MSVELVLEGWVVPHELEPEDQTLMAHFVILIQSQLSDSLMVQSSFQGFAFPMVLVEAEPLFNISDQIRAALSNKHSDRKSVV